MKSKTAKIIKIICFCLIAVLMVSGLTDLLKPKWLENRWASAKTNKSFYELEKDSLEVAFYGSSVIAAAIDPFQLYEEHGISAYNMGVMSQPMIGTYFWFKETLKTQDLKLAVIEIKSGGRSQEKAEEKARKSYDYMKWGLNKIQYALEYKDFHRKADGEDDAVDLWSYLFPLNLYHTRWSELTYDDYDFFLGNNSSHTRGFAVLSTKFRDRASFDAQKEAEGLYDGFEIDTEEKEEPNAINADYLQRLIELANKEGVQLLFVKAPDTAWNVTQHNYISSVAKENNIEFIDFNLKENRKKIDFDYSDDAADSVHINMLGAEKITKYLGNYISENYKLTDFRKNNNSVKKDYEGQKPYYEAMVKQGELSFISNPEEYLTAINMSDYEVIMVAGPMAGNTPFSETQKELLVGLGLDSTAFEYCEYGKNIVSIIDEKNKINKVKPQNSSGTAGIVTGGTLDCGIDYSVEANSTGIQVRLNNDNCAGLNKYGFNIIVIDKKLREVVDMVYFDANDNMVGINRGE